MSEINYEFWNKIFECRPYENIDQDTLIHLIKKVKDMKKDLIVMQQEFEEIYNFNFQSSIKQEKSKEDMSEEVQCNVACTQQNTDNAKAKKINYDQVEKKLAKDLDMINSIEQRTTDEKSELIRDNKYLLFVEIIHQDEIRRVNKQIDFLSHRLCSIMKLKVIPKQIETFIQQIDLMSYVLELEDEVLNFKLKREQERMTGKVKTIDVEMTNMSCKIDQEKLTMDNKYLRFVETTRQREINRICIQLQIYCDKCNIPNEEVKIATHRDLIMQRVEQMKRLLEQKVIDFNLQIEQEATNMETKNTDTSNMSSKVDNVKNTLMKSNKYLRYIAMKHQEAINRVYAQLQTFCNEYNMAIEGENISVHPNEGADDIEKTNMLRKSNEYFRSVRAIYQEEFVRIYDRLQMYNDKYDMPNEKNVTIVMHTTSYDSMKTHDEENELKKDNEYLAFIAMMHLEKIKEICAFFEMYRKRFFGRIERIAMILNFMKQKIYVNTEMFLIKCQISTLKKKWEAIKNM